MNLNLILLNQVHFLTSRCLKVCFIIIRPLTPTALTVCSLDDCWQEVLFIPHPLLRAIHIGPHVRKLIKYRVFRVQCTHLFTIHTTLHTLLTLHTLCTTHCYQATKFLDVFLPVIFILTENNFISLWHIFILSNFFYKISAPGAMSRRRALFWNFTQRKNGSSVATFRDNQSVPSSRDKQSAWTLKMGLISCH
jgi:hypothetical protein